MKVIEENQKAVPGLKHEIIGSIITPELKEYFRKYLGGDDKAAISQNTGVGYHTVDKLLSGANPLTENNSKALVPAVNFTITRIEEEIKEAQYARRRMKSFLTE